MTRRSLTQDEVDDAKRLRKIWNDRKEDLMLSQVKVAEEMGFSSQAAVSQYLNAKLPLNMSAVAKFAKVLRAKVEDISPRYAQMVGDPIPSSLEGYTAPQTGSIGGVPCPTCLNWFAFHGDFVKAMGAKTLKIFRNPEDDRVYLVDDSPQKSTEDGLYLMLQGDRIVVKKVAFGGDGVVIQNGKKMTVSKEAFSLIKVLAKVVARFDRI